MTKPCLNPNCPWRGNRITRFHADCLHPLAHWRPCCPYRSRRRTLDKAGQDWTNPESLDSDQQGGRHENQ